MRTGIILIISILTTANVFCQDITGQWFGRLETPNSIVNLVFNISKTDEGYKSTIDSPGQKAMGIPIASTSFISSVLKMQIANSVEYEGILNNENIFMGNFKQAGKSFPMKLTREKEKRVRPQEPVKPYPYYSEDIKFFNKNDNIELAGTLTLPKKEGKFPVVVLISGSGPQNRDEEVLGHKPFLVIADHLTKNGIAVLRYDDRGTAESKGVFNTANSYDFSKDGEAAVEYLKTRKEINKKKIGLIGHSDGGVSAPLVAARNKDINYIVLLAGPGLPGAESLLFQAEMSGRASNFKEEDLQKSKTITKGAFDIILRSSDTTGLKRGLTDYFKEALKEPGSGNSPSDNVVRNRVNTLMSPWYQYFLRYDPALTFKKVKCPVLALNGEKDLASCPAELQLAAIKMALEKGGNKNVTTIEMPDLNHLFQECETGLVGEYERIEQTFSPKALNEITIWISKLVK